MGHVHPNRAGLAFAAILAGWHAVWALLVAFGGAQQVYDFAYKLHCMKSDAVVGPFDPAMAALLIAATGVIGYLSGFGIAVVMNCLHGWLDVEEPGLRHDMSAEPSLRRRAS
jgi:hypothetical protein